MDRSYLFTYLVPFVSVFVLAASIGGAVLGAYVPVQQTFGLCGQPEMTVFTPETAPDLVSADSEFQEFEYSALSEPTRVAFEDALTSPVDKTEVEEALPPDERDALRQGILVRYEGTQYYATIVPHECVSTTPLPAGGASPLVLSLLGIVGIGVGGAGLVAPILWRRRSGESIASESSNSVVTQTARSALAPFREGEYEGFALVGSFGGAVVVSIVPFIGPLLGGSIIGATAATPRRAGLLGTYAGALVTGLLGANAALGVFPGALEIIPRSVLALVPGLLAIDPSLITGVVVAAPIVLVPIAATITRIATRSF